MAGFLVKKKLSNSINWFFYCFSLYCWRNDNLCSCHMRLYRSKHKKYKWLPLFYLLDCTRMFRNYTFFFYKNIEIFQSLQMFWTFCTLSLKISLKCSYFLYFLSILVQFPKKLRLLMSASLLMFLTCSLLFGPRSLMFLYSLFL